MHCKWIFRLELTTSELLSQHSMHIWTSSNGKWYRVNFVIWYHLPWMMEDPTLEENMLAGSSSETPRVVLWDSFCCLITPGESLSVKEPLSLSIPPETPTSSVKGQNEYLIRHCKHNDDVPKNQRFNENDNGWSDNYYYLFFIFS